MLAGGHGSISSHSTWARRMRTWSDGHVLSCAQSSRVTSVARSLPLQPALRLFRAAAQRRLAVSTSCRPAATRYLTAPSPSGDLPSNTAAAVTSVTPNALTCSAMSTTATTGLRPRPQGRRGSPQDPSPQAIAKMPTEVVRLHLANHNLVTSGRREQLIQRLKTYLNSCTAAAAGHTSRAIEHKSEGDSAKPYDTASTSHTSSTSGSTRSSPSEDNVTDSTSPRRHSQWRSRLGPPRGNGKRYQPRPAPPRHPRLGQLRERARAKTPSPTPSPQGPLR